MSGGSNGDLMGVLFVCLDKEKVEAKCLLNEDEKEEEKEEEGGL